MIDSGLSSNIWKFNCTVGCCENIIANRINPERPVISSKKASKYHIITLLLTCQSDAITTQQNTPIIIYRGRIGFGVPLLSSESGRICIVSVTNLRFIC